MITGFFLSVIFSVISFFLGLLPTTSFPLAISQAVNSAWGYINAFSFLFPVGTLLICLGIVLGYYITIFALDIGLWVIHLIRGR